MNVFCPSCGHRFDTMPPPHDPDGVVSCPKCLSTFATSGLAEPAGEPRRKLKKKPAKSPAVGPAVAVSVVAVVGAVAAGVYFGVLRDKPTGDAPRPTSVATKPGSPPPPPVVVAPAEWKEFVSPEGKFRVMTPAKLSHKKLPNGSNEYKLDTGELLIGVVYADLVGATLGKKNPEKVITAERDSLIQGGGRLVRETDVASGDHKGIEVVLDMPNRGPTYYRWYAAGRRVYRVEFGGKNATPHDADAKRFFESFAITG